MAFEGFSERGQGSDERGPGTFTFAPPGAPQTGVGEGMVRTQGGTVKPQDVSGVMLAPQAPAWDKTLTNIVGFADKAFGKKLDEIKQQEFLRGMQRAAAGEALTGIINEQPWYSKIFGPSSAADGARSYTAQAAVTGWMNQQEADMLELRKQSPDTIPAYLNEAVNKAKTGDINTDVMIGVHIMNEAPALMKRHARENYKYQQEEAVKAKFAASSASASSLQIALMADDAIYTPEEIEDRVGNFYSTLSLKPGEDPVSHLHTLKTLVQAQGQQGNFHVLNRLENDGILNDLLPADQLAVRDSIRSAQYRQLKDAADSYGGELFDIQAAIKLGRMSADEARVKLTAINDRNTRLTGNPMDLVNKSALNNAALTAAQLTQAAMAASVKEAQRADAVKQNTEALQSILRPGGVTTARAIVDGYKADDVDRTFKTSLDEAPTPEARAQRLAWDSTGGRANPYVKEEFNRKLTSVPADGINDDWLGMYGEWKNLMAANGQEAVALHFPKREATLMAAFHAELGSRDPAKFGPVVMEAARARVKSESGYRYDKKLKEEDIVKGYINAELDRNAWYKSRTFTMTDTSKALLLESAREHYGANKSAYKDQDLLLKMTMANVQAEGVEYYGDHAWRSDPNRPRLLGYFNGKPAGNGGPVTPLELGHAMNHTIAQKVKSITDKTPEVTQVIRIRDQGQEARFMVQVIADGEIYDPIEFGSEDISASLLYGKQQKVKPQVVQAKREASGQRPGHPLDNPRYGNLKAPSDYHPLR